MLLDVQWLLVVPKANLEWGLTVVLLLLGVGLVLVALELLEVVGQVAEQARQADMVVQLP